MAGCTVPAFASGGQNKTGLTSQSGVNSGGAPTIPIPFDNTTYNNGAGVAGTFAGSAATCAAAGSTPVDGNGNNITAAPYNGAVACRINTTNTLGLQYAAGGKPGLKPEIGMTYSLGFDFDAGLDLRERAQAWAFERMIEHHVYWALVGARWVDPDNFAKGPTHFFDGAPEHLRDKLREDAQFRVAENYLLSGLGRHAPDDDVDLVVRSLFALSVQLGDRPYLMGDRPSGVEFSSSLPSSSRTLRASE